MPDFMYDTPTTDAVLAGLALAAFVVILVLHHRSRRVKPAGREVGLRLFAIDPSPIEADETAMLTEYGGTYVHRSCLDARRDVTGVICSHCLPIVGAVMR